MRRRRCGGSRRRRSPIGINVRHLVPGVTSKQRPGRGDRCRRRHRRRLPRDRQSPRPRRLPHGVRPGGVRPRPVPGGTRMTPDPTTEPSEPAEPEATTPGHRPATTAIRAGRVGDGTVARAPGARGDLDVPAPASAEDARKAATSRRRRLGSTAATATRPSPASRTRSPRWRAPRRSGRSAPGMGRVSAVVLRDRGSSGDHIVAQRQIYAATQLLLQAVCPRFGIDVTFVDGTEPGGFAAAVVPGRTTLVIAETPGQPEARRDRPRRPRRHRRPGHRRRRHLRHADPPAAVAPTASTWCCTRPPRASRVTTTRPSAWWRAAGS